MALQGIAVHYNHVIIAHQGEHKMVLPNAFGTTLASGASVKFQLGHHEGESIGSTVTILNCIQITASWHSALDSRTPRLAERV
jgi:hypothetical protein